jgi:two-component system phosphate regulon sensor histidine kinase PhoR
MVLRSKTIRLGIFVSTFIIAVIISFQLIWLHEEYQTEQNKFDRAVARVVRGFYEDLSEPSGQYFNLNQLIKRIDGQTFFARLGRTDIDKDSLAFYMQSELEDEDVFTDCYVGLFDAEKKKYIYTVYLPSATAAKKAQVTLPLSNESYHHLTLFFPHRRQYILSLMNTWILGSAILLLVLILFGGSLYYFYRQKFLNEMQKDFVNNFTHEFKTPVAVINLAAEVLNHPGIVQKPEKLSRYAAIVQYQGNYLQSQIERLLRHAYAENNSLYLKKEVVHPRELIEEALNNLQPLIQSKNAIVNCELNDKDAVLLADRGYLLIVVINLVENALKYSTQPKISINTFCTSGNFILSIKDNGKGIGKKHLDKIFRKFYRVPNGEEVSIRGFGLGLAFVKKIVMAHRGKIKVESIDGVGSDFQVSLPLS